MTLRSYLLTLALTGALLLGAWSPAAIAAAKPDDKAATKVSAEKVTPKKATASKHTKKLSKSTNCARPTEKTALDVRALQTEMMLAGLTCDERDRYTKFVTKYKGELGTQSKAMTAYFNRVYKGQGRYQMDRFVTRLANDRSSASWGKTGTPFCLGARQVFDKLLAPETSSVIPTAEGEPRFAELHGIPACSEAKALKKSAAKLKHKEKAAKKAKKAEEKKA